jgi:hypothetical protein
MEEQAQPESKFKQAKPDTVFKEVTGKMAVAVGLDLLNVELPRLPSTDLIVHVPPGSDLSATPFEFLYSYSILEFKSENDPFDEFEFAISLARSLLFYNRFRKAKYQEMLTVFVCARYPDDLKEHFDLEKIKLKPAKKAEWLLQAKYGSLNLAFVICRYLPLEEKYYRWLIFASSKSAKWKEFVKMMLRMQNQEILDLLTHFRYKELVTMATELKKEETQGTLTKEDEEIVEALRRLLEAYSYDPQAIGQFFSKSFNNMSTEELDKLIKLIESEKRKRLNGN